MRLIESYEPGERVRIEPGRWNDGQATGKSGEGAGTEATIVRLGAHSSNKLPNGTEEDVYVVQLDSGKRSCVGTGSLLPLQNGQSDRP